jgi:hypothetical protein
MNHRLTPLVVVLTLLLLVVVLLGSAAVLPKSQLREVLERLPPLELPCKPDLQVHPHV